MTLSTNLRERRAAIKAQLDALVAGAESRADKNFSPAETARFDGLLGELRAADSAISDTDAAEAVQTRAAQARAAAGEGGPQRWSVAGEAATYRPDSGLSFFRDLVSSKKGDFDAAQRLQRNNSEMALERRALGNTGGTGGSGGEFAPPAWLESEFVALARAARVAADRLTKRPLPAGVSSVNIPKVTSGTATAVQTTQNTTVAAVDPTTSALTSGITTIAGKVVVSLQLLQQSPVALDQMLLGDLAADYARTLDLQVISGTGAGGQLLGLLNVAGITQTAYTQATPSVTGTGGYYATINKAIAAVATSRFLPPTCILMHPRRWSWVAAAFDSSGRPLVSPSGNAFNQIADASAVAARGPVGEMAGLPVFTDANLPTNLGAGLNQDPTLVLRAEDVFLWETEPTLASFDAPYSDSLGVLFRAHGYSALIGSRYPASIAVVNGTGTVTPAY
jgi:HK97 family phage major capsid protein